MNEPIINPIIFYIISVINKIDTVLTPITCISGGIVLVLSVVYILEKTEGDEKDRELLDTVYKKIKRPSLIIFIISLSLHIFCPSQEVMYKMLVSNYITPQNIESLKMSGEGAIDYIVNKVDEIIDNNDKEEGK